MANCLVTCITKPNVNSPHEHITHVGNPAWPMKQLTVEDVIQRINSRTDTFYVADWLGNQAMIGVVNPGAGRRPFIRTYADGKWTDNLLALDQCRLY
ncbi:DUF3892 domain-containing protein [Herbaspirillum sp.]|uniref:DUF3892 domain-containing protein n=1 Tax=Herbaspirillum sp. TaxID=1890675 RepID=UPI001B037AF7|nr:DUF3892 domain-containing protein [Herbaspirillum sp.]MBO9537353.1 DUF3892 domain-containing protein [Herbaspirillum sp.]